METIKIVMRNPASLISAFEGVFSFISVRPGPMDGTKLVVFTGHADVVACLRREASLYGGFETVVVS